MKKCIKSMVMAFVLTLTLMVGYLYTSRNFAVITFVGGEPALPAVNVSTRAESGSLSSFVIEQMSEGDGPGETIVGGLHDHEGREIKYIEETGQLFVVVIVNGVETYELLHTVSDAALTYYNVLTQEILDSANRKMKIWFDSISMQYTVGSEGGKYLKTRDLSDPVYIASIVDRDDGLNKTIYVTRKRVKTDIRDRLNPFKPKPKYIDYYYDLNEREIPDSWFVDHKYSPWVQSLECTAASLVGGLIGGALGGAPGFAFGMAIGNYVYGVFVGYTPVDSIVAIEDGTIGELLILLEFATWHPWQQLDGLLTANNDGVYNSGVYVNPANRQLCDRLGSPLYHIETGYPFVFQDEKINTIPDKKEQTVSANILQNAATREYLRKLGFEPYVHYIDSQEFGILNVLVLAVLDGDGKLQAWTFPNGESADGVIRNGVGIRTDGKSFLGWFKNLGGSIFSGFGSFGETLSQIIGFIFIFIIIVIIFKVLSFVLDLFKKKDKK